MHWTSPAGKHYATDPATRLVTPLPRPTTDAPDQPGAPTPFNWFNTPKPNPGEPGPF
ncbi:hypothetical protein BJ997_001783 [Cryobacterium roopkundense]|uniref:Uncharacterized protein n=1 Tax=Cryobacterium roopkundense TaxID=1001240 RepID=A0A7W8ZWF1_9MICO|nr:hypothetical protein [Cryobacterium roopkundense]